MTLDLEEYHTNEKCKKLKFYDSECKYSSRIKERSHKGKYKYTSESSESDSGPRKRKYKPYEEILGEFKNIKPFLCLMEKCKRVKEPRLGFWV